MPRMRMTRANHCPFSAHLVILYFELEFFIRVYRVSWWDLYYSDMDCWGELLGKLLDVDADGV